MGYLKWALNSFLEIEMTEKQSYSFIKLGNVIFCIYKNIFSRNFYLLKIIPI